MKKRLLVLLATLFLISSFQALAGFDEGFAAAQKGDYATALKEWQPLAEQGHVSAQYSLGWMHENGRGVAKDEQQAVAWYRKAADQGHVTAQFNLGVRYTNGRGVAQDDQQAIIWYRKAEQQGYVPAQNNLAELNDRLSCHKLATTKLFGIAVKCADRDALRVAVKAAGAVIKREDSGYFADTYHSENLLKNSDELLLLYTGKTHDSFAQAQYTFNSHLDTHQVSRIKEMVASKYDAPHYSKGNLSVGKVTYQWNLNDGIELKVFRGWPSTTTFLVYTYPKHYKIYEDKVERLRHARLAKEAEAQSNNF